MHTYLHIREQLWQGYAYGRDSRIPGAFLNVPRQLGIFKFRPPSLHMAIMSYLHIYLPTYNIETDRHTQSQIKLHLLGSA